MQSKITLKFQDGSNSDFHVWSLKLNEGVSALYRAELGIVSERVRTVGQLKSDALGKKISVTIEQAGDSGTIRRPLHGMVTSVIHEGSASLRPGWLDRFGARFPKGSLFRIVIEPEAAQLRLVRRSLDYPDTTPLGAVKAVFARHGIAPMLDSQYIEQEKYQGKVRFIQRNETDFDFVSRVLARYGISFFFHHGKSAPEQLYLSDGKSYPAAAELEFSGFPPEYQNALDGVKNGSLNFSMTELKHGSGVFRMKSFAASSSLGVEHVKTAFLHPAESRDVTLEKGSAEHGRSWLLGEPPAGYGENIDDQTLRDDLDRAMEAAGRSLRLACDDWRGETDVILPMPGKNLNLSGFYSAGEGDSPLSARILAVESDAVLGENGSDSFRVRFSCMDCAAPDDAPRYCPPVPEKGADAAVSSGIREALVCDREGRSDDPATVNRIVTSPHTTPDMPWLFLVRNENPDSGNRCVDVVMTMPLGGKRSGMYRFPRVGDRVLIHEGADRAVLLGYVPDRSGAFSEFFEGTDQYTRNASSLRYTPPGREYVPFGRCDEIGFSHAAAESEFMEQRIVDGTAYSFLLALATAENDLGKRENIRLAWGPRLLEARKNYFMTPGSPSVKAVRDLARETVTEFHLDGNPVCRGGLLKLFSNGSILQYAKNGIDITTEGVLNIHAAAVNINGSCLVNLQSDGVVRSVVGPSSVTTNNNGVAMRSLKVIDAVTNYDSAVYVNATDGVAVTGGNLRFDGLFSARMSDALGAAVKVSGGVLQGAGGVVDIATVTRDAMTDAFSKLDETSGLNRITQVLDSWKAGTTPDGGKRSIADCGIGIFDPIYGVTLNGAHAAGNFRGTVSGLSAASENLAFVQTGTMNDAVSGGPAAFQPVAGGKPELTVSTRELLRAKAFSQQLDVQRQMVETVNGTILAEQSASITVHGHQIDVNVMYINDLSSKHMTGATDGAGKS